MKKTILLTGLSFTLLTGCVNATYQRGDVKVSVTSFFRDAHIEKLTLDKKTEKTYQGLGTSTYDGTVNAEALKAVAAGVAEGLAKGAK